MKSKEDAKKIIAPDGVEIYYWVTKNKSLDKNMCVLHPPAAMNHSSLEKLEHMLNNDGHPTLTFDPRGSGYSDHPIPREYFGLDRVTGDLAQIIQKEGIENPDLIVYSFGFMPAVNYVAKTNNANKIVGISASHNFKETAPNKTSFYLFDKLLIYSEFAGSAGMYMKHLLKGEKRTLPEQSHSTNDFQVWCSIVDISMKQAASHVFGQREVNTWDVSDQLKQIQVPMAIINGAKDYMVRPKAVEYIKGLVKGECEVHIIPNATHSLPILYPELVYEFM